MRLTDTLRPTSFSMEQWRRALEERGSRLARSGIYRMQFDNRPWQEPDRGVTSRSTDNYPVYKEISLDDGITGTMTLGG